MNNRQEEEPTLTWTEHGVPFAPRFDDTYYSRENGQAETRHVFLAGNHLPTLFETNSTISVAELGFGTGLNCLECLTLWAETVKAADAHLNFTSFELYPLTKDDMAAALKTWQGLETMTEALLDCWKPEPGFQTWQFAQASLTLYVGDAADGLDAWQGAADAWFLDGFNPKTNPDLWAMPLLQTVFDKTRPGGRFATYTAAGWVRRNLQQAGFTVERVKGYGRKREMLVGQKQPTA